MRTLTDFFNHGTLPFVGRKTETERLLTFWNEALNGRTLRAAMVTGEEGVGKSRLLEEVVPAIVGSGGVVIPIKLYRSAMPSLVPLIRQALTSATATLRLLRNEPENTMASIVDALHRLSHLRPTLLVVEDMDQLNRDSIREFGELMEAIGHESLSIICVSRPTGISVRGVLERYMIEEVELSGLTDEDLKELWHRLFRTPVEPAVLQTLRHTTLGSPLAVRSALRGALKSEAIAYDPAAGTWKLTLDIRSFAHTLKRNVQLLSEGMAAHLLPTERLAAERLACLGETFAVETARAVLDDADQAIDSLIFKGILGIAGTTVTPLPTSASEFPVMVFTHTVVHGALAQSASVDMSRMLEVIAAGLPLYSTLPFSMVARRVGDATGDPTLFRTAIERSLEVALTLDRGPDRDLGMHAWQGATALFNAERERWDQATRRLLSVRLLYTRLRLVKGTAPISTTLQIVDEILAQTAAPAAQEILGYRFMVLAWPQRMDATRDYSDINRAWTEAEEILARHPELATGKEYAVFLRGIADIAVAVGDRRMLRRIEQRYTLLIARADLPHPLRTHLWKTIYPYLLTLFDSVEELNERIGSLRTLEASIYDYKGAFTLLKATLLEMIGYPDEALTACNETIAHLGTSYARRNHARCRLRRISLLMGTGLDPQAAATEALEIYTECASEISYRYRVDIASSLAVAGLLRDAPGWPGTIARIMSEERLLAPEIRVLLAVARNALRQTAPSLPESWHSTAPLRHLIRCAIGEADGDPTEACREATGSLPEEILSLHDLLRIHAVIALVEAAGLEEVEPLILKEIARAIERGLAWLWRRSLFAYMTPFIERHGRYLDADAATWRQRIEEIEKKRRSAFGSDDARTRLTISMLGKITVRKSGDDEMIIRGLRQRTLLGLMVADKMLENPLSHSEFCRIAGTGVDDPEHARKMMNGTVWRLRDLLGQEAIITDVDTPRLNPELVRIDLLETQRLLRAGREALRSGALMRVAPLLVEALELSRGEVPFPGLYDNFFEAAREDFEFDLHSTVTDAAGHLLREGDPKSAEMILRRCFEIMPDDEEIADLLCRALAQLGKRMEAERVRMRNADAVEE